MNIKEAEFMNSKSTPKTKDIPTGIVDRIIGIVTELYPPERRIVKVIVSISKDFEKEVQEYIKYRALNSGLIISAMSISGAALTITELPDYNISIYLVEEHILSITKE